MRINEHRRPHVMKQRKTGSHPSNFMFFDTETKDISKVKDKDKEYHALWFGVAWCMRYEGGKPTRNLVKRFNTKEGFYEILESRLDNKRPLYVFAHNLGFDLTSVDFWIQADERGYECNYCILENPPLFLSYTVNKCKVVFLDTFNFWKTGVAEMGSSLKMEKLSMPDINAPYKEWTEYCKRDVEILVNQVVGLIDFLSENNLGSFSISAPSLAMNTFKRCFMKHEVLLHDRSAVLLLERQCYYGGLVKNFFIGKSNKERLINLDVNSLYPFVMQRKLPISLEGSEKNVSVTRLRELLKNYGICADVIVDSHTETYLKKNDGKLKEYIGRFQTYLCGEELENAVNRNHVRHCSFASWYKVDYLLQEYVTFFWNLRKEYQRQGDKVKEQFVKLLLNSLYGKFAMRGYNWQDYSLKNLEEYYLINGGVLPDHYRSKTWEPPINGPVTNVLLDGLDKPVPFRYLGGKIQIKMPTGEHSESFTAISGFITSYAREHLRTLVRIASPFNVYYCDTDSLFVNQRGYRNLINACQINPTELGMLKVVGESSEWEFNGPKDYRFGGKDVLKGIRKNAIKVSKNTFKQVQFEGLKSILKRGGQGYIEIKQIIKHLSREFDKGTITNNGRVIPLVLND